MSRLSTQTAKAPISREVCCWWKGWAMPPSYMLKQAIGPIVLQNGENEELTFGDKVGLRFDSERIHVFGADGRVI